MENRAGCGVANSVPEAADPRSAHILDVIGRSEVQALPRIEAEQGWVRASSAQYVTCS
jgi:hypothetical protein